MGQSLNHFTARLLLLLESDWVHNEGAYRDIVKECVQFYYRDYHDHVRDFRATFLVNDIIRFWKMFCLNYENRRNRPATDPAKQTANHLKNLKLKFSRLWTCFSMVLCLAKDRRRLTPERVLELVAMKPQDRILEATRGVGETAPIVAATFQSYARFLDQTGRPKADTLRWIAERGSREEAFREADQFGDRMHSLLAKVADPETMRFLVM